jgi:outer membrane lipoprotein-sorting protein
MKKLALFTLGFFLAGPFLSAQELDEVLQKYFETIGMDKIAAVQTMTMTGKAVQMGMETDFTTIAKRPYKFRLEVDIQGQKMIQAFDGEKGWIVAPWSGTTDPQEIPAEQIKFMKWQAEIDGFLYNYNEKGMTTELVGKEDLEGTEVFKIQQTNQDGDVFTYYLDAENYVILKSEISTKMLGTEIKQEGHNSNFKVVEGMVFPFSIENKSQGQVINQVVVDTIFFNSEVNDSIFVMPAKKVIDTPQE